MKIALAGNPNSGKTTMYNAITGQNEKVGNWAGVTVEKKEHKIKKKYLGKTENAVAVDLPGAYSMSPFTSEESITSGYIKREAPDVIINIVDATSLDRSLFFTTQLLELGIPVVVALNKSDASTKNGIATDIALLSAELGCPVIETSSIRSKGISKAVQAAISIAGRKQTAPFDAGTAEPNSPNEVKESDKRRFEFVNSIVETVQTRSTVHEYKLSDKADKILTSRWLGIPLFAIVMLLVFQISQTWLGTWIAEGIELKNGTSIPGLVTFLEMFQTWIAELLSGASPILKALLIDGILGGVIAVVGFLPLVMVMYFLIAILEDCGYMARVAALLDPIFKKVGLSGRSVIPFVITIGCAVPGIMASRTIKNERERRATAMLAPFMPCGAKIPVISLFAGAFFGNQGWVSAVVYLLGIALIFIGALIVKKTAGAKEKRSFFILELPEYKLPSIWNALKTMCSRGKAYIVKATTIILLCNTAVQLMQTFTWQFSVAESADASILASIATPFAYILLPIVGVLSWQLAAAAITGLIAKENVVGTLAVCFVGLENLIDTDELAILEGSGNEVAGIIAISKAAALAYLMFNLYTPPCFAAIGAMSAEMKSKKWVWAGIGLQFGIGFTVSYLVYTVGTLIFAPSSLGIIPAIAGACAAAGFVGIIAVLINRANKEKAVTV